LDGGVSDISRSRTIAAPSQAVWDVLADFGAISTWVDNVGHSCLLNHGPGGEPMGTTRRVQVGSNTLVERIVEFDAPSTLAYDIEGLPARLGKVANRWTLRPAGATTQVTLTCTLKIGTRPPARLAERVLLRFVAKQSDQLLAGLAHRLESPHG
jgi:carbon monoxide dehydrogenase subunit G